MANPFFHDVALAAALATGLGGMCAACSRAGEAPKPVVSIKELMDNVVDPSADVLFDSVVYDISVNGTTEKVPQTREDWVEIRRHALLLAETANLLMMPGRKVAPDTPVLEREHNEHAPGDLFTEQIEALRDEDPPKFARLARGLRDAATLAIKAADARNVDALFASGDELDRACESCHLQYWYPKDKRPALEALSRRKK